MDDLNKQDERHVNRRENGKKSIKYPTINPVTSARGEPRIRFYRRPVGSFRRTCVTPARSGTRDCPVTRHTAGK